MSQLRLPLIVLVTFAHSYSGVAQDYSLLSSGFDIYQVLKLLVGQTLTKLAVPVFFVMSGYLFFIHLQQWDWRVYGQKLKRRLTTLLLPYVVWNLLMAFKLKSFSWSMLWVYVSAAGKQTDWLGMEHQLTAPANMPLWFLRDLMVVSLLSPIIYIGVRKCRQWFLPLLGLFYLSGVCPFVPGLSAYAVFFFTLGAALSLAGKDLLQWSLRHERLAYVCFVGLGLAMMLTYRTSVFSSLMLCFRLVGVVVVFCAAYRVMLATARRLPPIVCDASYFVYLAHYVVFFAVADDAFFSLFGTSQLSLSLHYLLSPLLKAAVFVALYVLYRKMLKFTLPYSRCSTKCGCSEKS